MTQEKTKKYAGMSLIEMLVAIGIFTMGVAGFTLLFTRSWQVNRFTLELGQTSMVASEGVNKMGIYIRSARQGDDGSFPLISGNDNDLVLFSDYDKDDITERLHFYKSGQNILMGIRDPTGTMPKSYPSGDQSVVTIAGNVVNNSDVPVFSYYNKNYPGDQDNNPLSTPVNVASVRLVKIHLQINIEPQRAPENVQTQSFVEIRNLNDYDRIE